MRIVFRLRRVVRDGARLVLRSGAAGRWRPSAASASLGIFRSRAHVWRRQPMNEYIVSFWQRPPGWGTKSCDARYRTRAKDQRGRTSSRRLGPMLALLEDRTLLSTATLTTLGISAGSLVYGQSEVLTAIVTTSPPSSTTPTGGTVSFMDGSTTLVTEGLTNGSATLATTGLEVGSHPLTAVYSGDAAFGSSSTVVTASVIKTIAGGGNGNGGPATQTSLYSPAAVALDAAV